MPKKLDDWMMYPPTWWVSWVDEFLPFKIRRFLKSHTRPDDSTQAPHLAVPFVPKALLLKSEETGPWKNVVEK